MSIPGVECARRRRVYEGRHTSSLAILNELNTSAYRHSRHHYYSFLMHLTPEPFPIARRIKQKELPLVSRGSPPQNQGPDQHERHKTAMEARSRLDERLRSVTLINKCNTVTPLAQSHYCTRNPSIKSEINCRNGAFSMTRINQHLGSAHCFLKAKGLGKVKIDNLQKEAFKERIQDLKTEGEQADCPVCLEHFAQGQMVVCLPCKHIFHYGCLIPWLEKDTHCPYCRSCLLDKNVS